MTRLGYSLWSVNQAQETFMNIWVSVKNVLVLCSWRNTFLKGLTIRVLKKHLLFQLLIKNPPWKKSEGLVSYEIESMSIQDKILESHNFSDRMCYLPTTLVFKEHSSFLGWWHRILFLTFLSTIYPPLGCQQRSNNNYKWLTAYVLFYKP